LLAEADEDGNYKIDNKNGYLILNPQHILSGTTILSSLHCIRKSALNWKFKDTGLSSGSSHMILGNVLHMLFQYAITNKKYEKNELNILLMEILKKKQIINQLYESNLDEEFILKETSIYLLSIEKWLKENVKLPLVKQTTTKNLQVLNVCDIEESIWSPKYGIKGKLDLTLQIEMKISAFKTLNSTTNTNKKNSNHLDSHVIPVELKSGRTTFSAEHEGQVMLYSLLNNEKRKTTDFGLLLYLKDMNMKFIKVSNNSIRGLIQLRNELVYYISSSSNTNNKLPELKNEERVCSKCPQLTICSLFNDQSVMSDFELYKNSINHLTQEHKDYFFKWFKMLELEFKDQKQFESGDHLWWLSKEILESKGFSVFDLQIVHKSSSSMIKNKCNDLNPNQYEGEGSFLIEFKRQG
jgi:DNA replication ATP-dependent helicase Dna2